MKINQPLDWDNQDYKGKFERFELLFPLDNCIKNNIVNNIDLD